MDPRKKKKPEMSDQTVLPVSSREVARQGGRTSLGRMMMGRILEGGTYIKPTHYSLSTILPSFSGREWIYR